MTKALGSDKIVVLVTCGKRAEAERLARALVKERLAACVNILSGVRSVYRWKGKMESAREHLLLIKSSKRKFSKLSQRIRQLHSYAVPEIIALPIAAGSPEYMRWLNDCLNAK
jgi:periplasmic divalent cation tolerance protein